MLKTLVNSKLTPRFLSHLICRKLLNLLAPPHLLLSRWSLTRHKQFEHREPRNWKALKGWRLHGLNCSSHSTSTSRSMARPPTSTERPPSSARWVWRARRPTWRPRTDSPLARSNAQMQGARWADVAPRTRGTRRPPGSGRRSTSLTSRNWGSPSCAWRPGNMIIMVDVRWNETIAFRLVDGEDCKPLLIKSGEDITVPLVSTDDHGLKEEAGPAAVPPHHSVKARGGMCKRLPSSTSSSKTASKLPEVGKKGRCTLILDALARTFCLPLLG